VITATDLEVRAGARTLLLAEGTALRVQPGDRIGLVGRNGAGKTTTMRILAGEGDPYAGIVTRSGEVGYLPQDPREGDLDVLARDRVLSARGLDTLLADLEKQQVLMAEVVDDDARDKAIRRYGHLEERFAALGGYAAESEAGRRCARSPAASGAASNWPASCSPPARAAPEPTPRCCWTSRPTTSTPTRSGGCATSSRSTAAGW
jgi:ATPase subunit of ABC transporter with duplicated ATPase domains